MKAYGLVMMAVTEFVVAILVLMFAGRWADGRYQGGGKFLMLGAGLGFAAGIALMFRRLKGVMNEAEKGE